MTTTPLAGFWNNKQCEESFPFVCEALRNGISPPTPAPTPPPVTGCESGWGGQPHFRNCYRVIKFRLLTNVVQKHKILNLSLLQAKRVIDIQRPSFNFWAKIN